MSVILRTPLNDWHRQRGARMIPFGGWDMPVQYSSVIHEHETVRRAVGITDVSHMGRLVFDGPGAGEFLDSVLSRNVAALQPGQIRYSLLTNEQGGIIDDLLVGLLVRERTGDPYYSVVVNASNREKDIAFITKFLTPEIAAAPEKEVRFLDETFERGMIAVQGPRSAELLQPFFETDLATMKYYSGIDTRFANVGRWAVLTRTGYTGEDGFEVMLEPFYMEQFVEQLFETGKELGIEPVGLGARDTLRLEAAMPLYGHELDEQTNPFEAGLGYALHLDGPAFPGSSELRRLKLEQPSKIRVGLEILDRRPAREGSEIHAEGRKIGTVTSGSFSPTLQKPIAMGYVPPEFSQPGQSLSVDVRGKMLDAVVVPLPFYKRT